MRFFIPPFCVQKDRPVSTGRTIVRIFSSFPPYFLPIYADINNRTKKVDSREGLEAYGYDKLYKVQAVTVIPHLRKASSDDERHQSKRDSSDSLSRKFFSEVFDEACKKEEQKNILIRTNGYTKAALPYYYNVNMREYR